MNETTIEPTFAPQHADFDRSWTTHYYASFMRTLQLCACARWRVCGVFHLHCRCYYRGLVIYGIAPLPHNLHTGQNVFLGATILISMAVSHDSLSCHQGSCRADVIHVSTEVAPPTT